MLRQTPKTPENTCFQALFAWGSGRRGGSRRGGGGGRPDGPCPGRVFDGPLALDRRAATRFTGNFVARDVRYMST